MQPVVVRVGRIDVVKSDFGVSVGVETHPEVLVHAAVEAGNPDEVDGFMGNVGNLKLRGGI